MHLLGFGPKRLTPDGKVITNDGSWLAATDLVFVDPVGTGYSRPVAAEYGREFYSDRGDAESIAEFIRVYLARAERWDAPLFLVGESFGVRRAGRVADVLERHGTAVRGVVLMGLALPLDTLAIGASARRSPCRRTRRRRSITGSSRRHCRTISPARSMRRGTGRRTSTRRRSRGATA